MTLEKAVSFDTLRKEIIEKRGSSKGIVQHNSKLCFDSFPRSGNSYLTRAIFYNVKIPKDLISHHTHNRFNVSLALSAGIPCMSVIRDPIDCLSSYAVYMGVPDDNRRIDFFAHQYLRFYQVVEKGGVILFDFNIAIKKASEFTVKVSELLGVDHNGLSNDQLDAQIKKSVHDMPSRTKGTPSLERTEENHRAKQILKSLNLTQQYDLYNTLISKTETI